MSSSAIKPVSRAMRFRADAVAASAQIRLIRC
jgi:hypothetical protein